MSVEPIASAVAKAVAASTQTKWRRSGALLERAGQRAALQEARAIQDIEAFTQGQMAEAEVARALLRLRPPRKRLQRSLAPAPESWRPRAKQRWESPEQWGRRPGGLAGH